MYLFYGIDKKDKSPKHCTGPTCDYLILIWHHMILGSQDNTDGNIINSSSTPYAVENNLWNKIFIVLTGSCINIGNKGLN